jgi:hypothetical protein
MAWLLASFRFIFKHGVYHPPERSDALLQLEQSIKQVRVILKGVQTQFTVYAAAPAV